MPSACAADVVQLGVGEADRDRDEHDDGHRRERGQQPPRAAGPEVPAAADVSVRAISRDDQPGDEEARDDEEHVDAEEARGQGRRREVVDR